jgi:hypothetical protein
LPAVIITGFAHVDTADALPKDVTVVHKPFPRGELVRVLVQSISRQPTSTQAK